MPYFYLNIRNSMGYAPDDEGLDLPDLAAAQAKAVEGIRSLLSEEVQLGVIDLRGAIEIADQSGQVVKVVAYPDAVELRVDGTGA